MSLQFHWFPPTYGDSRLIVGGVDVLPAVNCGDSSCPFDPSAIPAAPGANLDSKLLARLPLSSSAR